MHKHTHNHPRAHTRAHTPARGVRVEGDMLSIEAEGPVAEVRYAWHMNAAAALRNGADLPAGPFVLKVSE